MAAQAGTSSMTPRQHNARMGALYIEDVDLAQRIPGRAEHRCMTPGYYLVSTDDPQVFLVVALTQVRVGYEVFRGDRDAAIRMRDLLVRSQEVETWAG